MPPPGCPPTGSKRKLARPPDTMRHGAREGLVRNWTDHKVEISLTGEGGWHPARVDSPKGPYQWQDWSFAWEATDVGRHSLRARATDAAGNVQPDVPPWNRLGYGNNAVEVLYVDVR